MDRNLARWWGPIAPLAAFALWQASLGRTYRGTAAIAVALAWMIATSFAIWPRIRWLLPAIAPLLAATVLGLAFLPRLASAAAVGGSAVLVLFAAGLTPHRALDGLVHAVATALRAIAGGAVFVLLIVPAWLWTRLRRRNPVRPADSAAPAWTPTATHVARAGSLSADTAPPQPRRRLAGRLAWGFGCVGLILAVNYGTGWLWDRAFPTTEAAVAPVDPPPDSPPDPITGELPRDPRADVPAMAAYPWREQYFDDIQRTIGGYWPFTEYRPADFASAYLNLDGWIRRSYEPAGDPQDMPTLWMFGGSTTWGEGQRDDYTIASWLARLSEEAGTPVRIDNYGQRAWTHFQEMVLYEQQLALRPAPDLAVFYDGANELTAQSMVDEAVPTHVHAPIYAQRLTGTTFATRVVEEPEDDTDLWPLVHDAYRSHSAIDKIIGWFQERADAAPAQAPDPAPAATTTSNPETAAGFTDDQQIENGSVTHYDVRLQDGTDAGKVYERGKALTRAVSRTKDVDTFFFWQPMAFDGEAEKRARAELSRSTIDISDALRDHPEVFIDGGHTNEEGARIVAERIWKSIAPAVEKWHDQHD